MRVFAIAMALLVPAGAAGAADDPIDPKKLIGTWVKAPRKGDPQNTLKQVLRLSAGGSFERPALVFGDEGNWKLNGSQLVLVVTKGGLFNDGKTETITLTKLTAEGWAGKSSSDGEVAFVKASLRPVSLGAAAVLALAAAGDAGVDAKKVAGRWELVPKKGGPENAPGEVLEFTGPGKMTLALTEVKETLRFVDEPKEYKTTKLDGTFKLDKGVLLLSFSGGHALHCERSKDPVAIKVTEVLTEGTETVPLYPNVFFSLTDVRLTDDDLVFTVRAGDSDSGGEKIVFKRVEPKP